MLNVIEHMVYTNGDGRRCRVGQYRTFKTLCTFHQHLETLEGLGYQVVKTKTVRTSFGVKQVRIVLKSFGTIRRLYVCQA